MTFFYIHVSIKPLFLSLPLHFNFFIMHMVTKASSSSFFILMEMKFVLDALLGIFSTYIEIDRKRRSVDHAFARTTDKGINGIMCFLFLLLFHLSYFILWNRILFIACNNWVYYNSKLVLLFLNDKKKWSGITLATIIISDFNDAR